MTAFMFVARSSNQNGAAASNESWRQFTLNIYDRNNNNPNKSDWDKFHKFYIMTHYKLKGWQKPEKCLSTTFWTT